MNSYQRRVVHFFMLFLLAQAGSGQAFGSQDRQQESLTSEMPGDPAKAAFRAGEKLTMAITWRPPVWLFFIPPISAGSITLEIKERIEYENAPAVRITGDAYSSGTFNSLAGLNVENHYESVLDLKTVCSRQFKFMQREGKRMQDVQIDFDPAAKSLHIREWKISKGSRAESRNESISAGYSCVQDLISVFYAVRGLRLQPGDQHSLALSNDHGKVQPIQLLVEGEEVVRTDAGTFKVRRITTSGLFGGLFRSGGEFKVWMDTSASIPVKFDAKVKLGRVTGSLVRYHPAR